MANAKTDNNSVRTAVGTSNADGRTILRLYVNPTTHAVVVLNGTTGSDSSLTNARRDQNSEPAMMGISNDGHDTPTECYIDSATNGLLVKST